MTRDERRLLEALKSLPHVTEFQAHAAYVLLQVNGIDNALEYVDRLRQGIQPTLPLEAAWEIWLEENSAELARR